MPRPQRRRRVCCEPEYSHFTPDGCPVQEEILLSIDEFEVIRLVDLEGMTHGQCAEQMDISRTTVTEIYESARRKLADSLVNGKRLHIAGGHYRLCEGTQHCARRRCVPPDSPEVSQIAKGENIMRIAVTYENGNIFQHFGHTAAFKLYDVADGAVTSEQVVETMGSGHGALASFLTQHQVDVLICGGIGGGAQIALAQAGIQLYGGVSGDADQAVQALLGGTLAFNPDVRCSHHDAEHGEGDHTCGEHGCGKHDCGSHSCH